MTEYISVTVYLSDSQVSNKNVTELYLSLLSNMIGHAIDETNFSHKLLLISRQVRIFGEALKMLKILQSVGFLGSFLRTLIKVVLVLMKNMHQPLGEIILTPLRLTVEISAADAGFYKKESWFEFV